MKNKIRRILGVKQKQMIGYHRYPLNPLRKHPEFIIIGSQKAASTSLHYYLALNSQVQKPPIKEAQFFNMNYDRGLCYYKSIFPIHKKGKVAFETTPDYLSHPLAPELCHQLLPNIKIIVTLRNPVKRAFSHFNFVKGYGGEDKGITFETALLLEAERIKNALNLLKTDRYHSAALLARYGYRRNGEYAEHIKNWLQFYDIENFYFVDFEDIKNDINMVMKKLCHFLNLPFEKISDPAVKNKSNYNTKIKKETSIMLHNYYKIHNENLFKSISKEFDW